MVQKNVNLGSYVQPGTRMMAIVPERLDVTANYKETQLSAIKVGQKVDLSIDAFPDVAFKGTVQSIQNGAGQAFQLLPPQNATGNFVKVVQRVPMNARACARRAGFLFFFVFLSEVGPRRWANLLR